MDLEQLKLILETLKSVGSDAKWLVILYFSKEFAGTLIGYALAFTGIFLAAKTIRHGINSATFGGNVMQALGYDRDDTTSTTKTNLVLDLIRRLKNADAKG